MYLELSVECGILLEGLIAKRFKANSHGVMCGIKQGVGMGLNEVDLLVDQDAIHGRVEETGQLVTPGLIQRPLHLLQTQVEGHCTRDVTRRHSLVGDCIIADVIRQVLSVIQSTYPCLK